MSLLSFWGSLLPQRSVANNTPETEEVSTMDPSDGFSVFPRLPAELRHMIIEEALHEHEESTYRVVLLDPTTRRISPTKELATMASPLLFVNTESRSLALKFYVKIDVLGLGAPKDNQYGDEINWYNVPDRREYLFYNPSVSEQICGEADEDGVRRGCVYINPANDIYMTGIIPRQVACTTVYRSLPDRPNLPWKIPRDYITNPLSTDICAKITTIRELEWDLDDRCLSCGTCLSCGRSRRPCCTENFFGDDERGADWESLYSQWIYTGVKSFGFYLLISPDDMQEFLSDVVHMGGEACLEEEWKKRYLEFDLTRLEE